MHVLYSCGRDLNFFTKSAISAGFIGRDELQRAVVPWSTAAPPVPEPPPVTCTVVPSCDFMYTSAHFWPRITIVSEPLTVILTAWAALVTVRSAAKTAFI